MSDIIIPNYSKDDYLHSTSPFEWLYQFKDNKLKMRQMMALISEKAGAVGVRNFITLFKAYVDTVEKKDSALVENVTDFSGQEMQLDCGQWQADDLGITTYDRYGFEITACNHPIMPVRRLVNIDTNVEKLELAYKKGGFWRKIIADKKTLASNNSILQLADYGVAVNSENAKYLVKFLTEVEHLNYDKIEEVNSVGRLGWIGDFGFAPYVDNLVFDGEINFKHFFESVRQEGDYNKWLEIARLVRSADNIPARIMLASGFASVLVGPLGALPFFVHIWGTTETGKTVALMLAASVWANPKMGEYIHSFNSTAVAQEMAAGFVNSLPLILDELQIIKERKEFDQIIYHLTEGVGRVRGQKTGGLQKVQTWQNSILTSGEGPITSVSSGGGAVNRIIEIECNDGPLFKDPVLVADTVKRNFGHAGRLFVEMLMLEGFERASELQKKYVLELSQNEATEKQSISASVILAADRLATEWIFRDGRELTIDDIKPYLSTKKDVSNEEHAFEYLLETIAANSNRFRTDSEYDAIWGKVDDELVYIIKSQFDKILIDGGYNPRSVLSWLRRTGKIKLSDNGKSTITQRVNGAPPCRCVCLKIEEIERYQDETDYDELPLPFDG